jgi:uncharacterized protein DUF6090
MKKILETLQRKWTEYLLEIVVIVAGILIAFMLNNWKENSDAEKVELRFYHELLGDLRANRNEIESFLFRLDDQSIPAIDTAYSQVNRKSTNVKALNGAIRGIDPNFNIDISSASYQYMVNEGFNFIGNDSLRLAISELYEIEMSSIPLRQAKLNNLILEKLNPIIYKYFEYRSPTLLQENFEIVNLTGLKKDLEFRNYLMHIKRASLIRRSRLNIIVGQIDALISDIQDIMAQMSSYKKPPPIVIDSTLINQITGKYNVENLGISAETFEENGRLFYRQYQDYGFYVRHEIFQVSGYQFDLNRASGLSNIQYTLNDNNEITGAMATLANGTKIPATKIE